MNGYFFRRIIFFLIIALPCSSLAQSVSLDEDAAKALNIIKFVPYIEWLDRSHFQAANQVNVCVIGSGAMKGKKQYFDKLSTPSLQFSYHEEKTAKGAASNCQIVFVEKSEEDKLPEILETLKSSPVLTVSDIEKFSENGGMIEFVLRENRVRFIVNNKAARDAKIKIGGQMLQIALDVVGG